MSYYVKEREKKQISATCGKCGAPFILHYGGMSERTPCRVHIWNSEGFCNFCKQHKSNYSGNCYHIRRDSILRCGSCCIS